LIALAVEANVGHVEAARVVENEGAIDGAAVEGIRAA